MKKSVLVMIAATATYLFAPLLFAQNDGPPPRERDGDRPGARPGAPGGDRPGGDRPGAGRRPYNPLAMVLDKDRDGVLSASEIEGASAALKTLDKNGDGQVTREEMRPSFGGQGGPGGGSSAGGGQAGGDFIARLMQNDKDKDGKLTKDELPERMQRILDRADTSGDGALDKAEMQAMAARFQGGGGGGRPGGDRPGGQGGPPNGGSDDRPKRPAFE